MRVEDPVRVGLGVIATCLIVGLLVLAGHRESGRMAEAQAAQAASAIGHAATLFGNTCAGCHGITGRGVEGVAPALNSPEFFTSRLQEMNYPGTLDAYVESVVSTGRTKRNDSYSAVMPPWSQAYGGPLRADEIRDVVRYVLNWEGMALGGIVVPEAAAPDAKAGNAPAAMGKVAYSGHMCLGCHGWPGRGGVTGPDLAGIGTYDAERMAELTPEQYIRVSILAPSARIPADCPPGPCPDMMPRNYGEELTQRELDDLVSYLLALR
jgi:mono/diheme cytochrome c family protein